MKALKAYMKRHEITQTELAKRMGVSQPAVSDWLRGASFPSVETLSELSRETGLTIDELLGNPSRAYKPPRVTVS